jgi:hypothetical protein
LQRATPSPSGSLFAARTGGVNGVAPSGNEVIFGVQNIYRFRDRKVIERWSNPDLLGLMQIGGPGTRLASAENSVEGQQAATSRRSHDRSSG